MQDSALSLTAHTASKLTSATRVMQAPPVLAAMTQLISKLTTKEIMYCSYLTAQSSIPSTTQLVDLGSPRIALKGLAPRAGQSPRCGGELKLLGETTGLGHCP